MFSVFLSFPLTNMTRTTLSVEKYFFLNVTLKEFMGVNAKANFLIEAHCYLPSLIARRHDFLRCTYLLVELTSLRSLTAPHSHFPLVIFFFAVHLEFTGFSIDFQDVQVFGFYSLLPDSLV